MESKQQARNTPSVHQNVIAEKRADSNRSIFLPRLAGASVLAVACFFAAGCERATNHARTTVAPVVLAVATDGELLSFDPTELTCPAGARVRLTFHHAGKRIPQEHNWVLLRPGAAEAVMRAAVAAGAASGFVPPNDARVLAATALCAPGADATVEFTAPEAGDYPFVCTFPGHGAVMNGTLHVLTK